MRTRTLISAAAIAVLALAGCSGDQDEAPTETATETATATATETETASPDETTEPTATDGAWEGIYGEWCLESSGDCVTIDETEGVTMPTGEVFELEEAVEDRSGCWFAETVVTDGAAGIPSVYYCPAGVEGEDLGIEPNDTAVDRVVIAQSAPAEPYLQQ